MTTPSWMPPLPSFEPQYKCHIDCFDGQQPDECTWDIGRPQDCMYTNRHGANGKNICGEWKPISVVHDSYTADQMRDYALAAYRAGQAEMRERAAVRMIEVMKQYRHDAFTHVGLGDIRLSIGAQEDLANDIRALPVDA